MVFRINYIQVTLLFTALWIRGTLCDYYCDDDLGICLHFNDIYLAASWGDAQNYCSSIGSILLEIYDEQYADVVLKAIHHFSKKTFMIGWYLLLGLEYNNGQYRWLTTNKTVDQLPLPTPGDLSGTCKCFVVFNGTQLRIEGECIVAVKHHRFICLKEKNNLATSPRIDLGTVSKPPSSISTRRPLMRSKSSSRKSNIAFGIAVTYYTLSSLHWFQ